MEQHDIKTGRMLVACLLFYLHLVILFYNLLLSDFMRIYNSSPEDYFVQLATFRQHYRKCLSKILDWSKIDRLDRRVCGTLESKVKLMKDMKLSQEKVNEI